MLKFLIRRVLTGALVLWIISMLVFALFFAVPNNVARQMAGHNATPTTIKLINQRLGLDQPLWEQYGKFIWNALHGDLGEDYYYQLPVTHVIAEALPITLSVVVGASIIWLLLGVSSGVLSAVRPRSFIDRLVTVLALFFYSVPSFVLGLTLLFVFYYKLTIAGFAIFPAGGYKPLSDGLNQWFFHMILPWITLAMISAATYTRLTRGSMLEVLGEDYIKTARAKGISERRVIYRHGLRSALTPVVTQFGIDVATLIGGAVITETVFSLPGVGYQSIKAIRNQDLPLILGVVLVASVAVVVANILVDLLYAVLDPRVRLS
ncbi:MAG: transporter permease [Marmoricola sp.]|nr:transporter permease [Marmoricola sp.]